MAYVSFETPLARQQWMEEELGREYSTNSVLSGLIGLSAGNGQIGRQPIKKVMYETAGQIYNARVFDGKIVNLQTLGYDSASPIVGSQTLVGKGKGKKLFRDFLTIERRAFVVRNEEADVASIVGTPELLGSDIAAQALAQYMVKFNDQAILDTAMGYSKTGVSTSLLVNSQANTAFSGLSYQMFLDIKDALDTAQGYQAGAPQRGPVGAMNIMDAFNSDGGTQGITHVILMPQILLNQLLTEATFAANYRQAQVRGIGNALINGRVGVILNFMIIAINKTFGCIADYTIGNPEINTLDFRGAGLPSNILGNRLGTTGDTKVGAVTASSTKFAKAAADSVGIPFDTLNVDIPGYRLQTEILYNAATGNYTGGEVEGTAQYLADTTQATRTANTVTTAPTNDNKVARCAILGANAIYYAMGGGPIYAMNQTNFKLEAEHAVLFFNNFKQVKYTLDLGTDYVSDKAADYNLGIVNFDVRIGS